MKRTLMVGALIVSLAFLGRVGTAQDTGPLLNWYRGNLHAHTTNSDGDAPPYDVMTWYKRNGYQFLAITDHNTFTDPRLIDTNPNDNFLVIGAEEITNANTVHVNAIGISRVIPAQSGSTSTELLQASIDAVRAQGGLPLINHPNLRWALTVEDMLPLQRTALLEIASGNPTTNHYGTGFSLSAEQMWDELLSANMRIFAVAVDDAHLFRGEFSIGRPFPGRAWVVVRAATLTRESILAALEDGEFYASTGVTLRDIRSTSESLAVDIQPDEGGYPRRFRVVFIGEHGRVLAATQNNPARYAFVGDEGYVRARIEDSRGLRAWTQPVFVESRP